MTREQFEEPDHGPKGRYRGINVSYPEPLSIDEMAKIVRRFDAKRVNEEINRMNAYAKKLALAFALHIRTHFFETPNGKYVDTRNNKEYTPEQVYNNFLIQYSE